jgi:hypothetical protein
MVGSKTKQKTKPIKKDFTKDWFLEIFSVKFFNNNLLLVSFIYVVLIIIIYALVREIMYFRINHFFIYLLKTIFMLSILILLKRYFEK